MRYSYVLRIPAGHAFLTNPDGRWQNFLGEFVIPIATQFPDLLFWCSFYGDHFRFRVHTLDANVTTFIAARIVACNLSWDQQDEETKTLIQDLGASRFIDSTAGAAMISNRAELVLKFLCATVRLYLDGLEQIGAHSWRYASTIDKENPLGNNFESLAHLMSNISQFEFDVVSSVYTVQTPWMHAPSSSSARCRLW